jgi:hypothetical protein
MTTFAIDDQHVTAATTPVSTVGLVASTLAADRGERHLPLSIPAGQAYYWSSEWQTFEREALDEFKAGDFHSFADPLDAIRYLLRHDDEPDDSGS